MSKERWGQEAKDNTMLYPDERVVAFLGRNFKDFQYNKSLNALDIGCGSGRQMKLLHDYGFNVYGIDYSQGAVDVAKDLLNDLGSIKLIEKKDLNECIWKEKFDVILLWGVIFMNHKEGVKRDLLKVKEMLKVGGKILLNFRGYDNWFSELGTELSQGGYILDERAKEYEGITYSFYTHEEAYSLLEEVGLKVFNTERLDYWKNNSKERHSWHIFYVEK